MNKTNLTEHYKVTLDWMPADRAVEAGSDIPDMFAALHEQLGLKLEPTRTSVEMLIIDQATKTTTN